MSKLEVESICGCMPFTGLTGSEDVSSARCFVSRLLYLEMLTFIASNSYASLADPGKADARGYAQG